MAKELGPGQAEATAIRADSSALREVLVCAGSDGRLEYVDLFQSPATRNMLEPRWAAALARVIALQQPTSEEERLAQDLLASAVPSLRKTPGTLKYRVLQVELLLDDGQFEAANDALAADDELSALHHGYLVADIYNPFGQSPFANKKEWVGSFNAPFHEAGVSGVEVDIVSAVPFDGLRGEAGEPVHDGPLVTVIVTSYCPDERALKTALESIVNQTWRNIEVIIVDDASPETYDDILARAASMDSRIRLHKMAVNGGTYIARNAGIKMASGEFITCQDSDDFSHPRRIELQVLPLLEDTELQATRSYCLAVQEDLTVHRRGYWPLRPNASSLMFRASAARQLGGFLRARKAADSEFHARLERRFGRPVADIRKPLALVRILPASLSRADFRGGWHHHARRSFRTSYQHWHENSVRGGLEVEMDGAPPIDIPARLSTSGEQQRSFDVVFLADWRHPGSREIAFLYHMKALAQAGVSVGLMHMDSAWTMHGRMSDISAEAQNLISSGQVARVLLDEAAYIDVLAVVDPTVVQFPTRQTSLLSVAQAVLAEDEVFYASTASHAGLRGCESNYEPDSVRSNMEALFSTECAVHEIGLARPGSSAARNSSDQKLVLEWTSLLATSTDRRSTASLASPTLGIRLPQDRDGERATRGLIRGLSVADPDVDVLVVGTRPASVFRRGRALPQSAVYQQLEILDYRSFLGSVDFLVVDAGGSFGATGLAVAIASGVVVISVDAPDDTLGPLVYRCSREELPGVLRRMWEDPDMMAQRRAEALDCLIPGVRNMPHGAAAPANVP